MAATCSGRIGYVLPFGWSAERPCRIKADEVVSLGAMMGGAEPAMCERHRAIIVVMLRSSGSLKSKALRRWMKGAGKFEDLGDILATIEAVA